MKKDLIRKKLSRIDEYLNKLEPILKRSTSAITDDDFVLHTLERLMQLIVDTAIDINTSLIRSEQLRSADDYYNTFVRLGEAKIIDSIFSLQIARSVGLRNNIVHNYEDMSLTTLIEKVKANIGDYREYVKQILEFLERSTTKAEN